MPEGEREQKLSLKRTTLIILLLIFLMLVVVVGVFAYKILISNNAVSINESPTEEQTEKGPTSIDSQLFVLDSYEGRIQAGEELTDEEKEELLVFLETKILPDEVQNNFSPSVQRALAERMQEFSTAEDLFAFFGEYEVERVRTVVEHLYEEGLIR